MKNKVAQIAIYFWILKIIATTLGETAGVIAVVLAIHRFTRLNDVVLFWSAFVFTRPFGATFGDFLTKPAGKGGLDLGTLNASAVAAVMFVIVLSIYIWRSPKEKS